MKLAELERHLRHHGCALYREGAAHSIWFNPALNKIASVPRHREIKEGTVRAICK
jgi:mRNA interferase HicA